VNKADFSKNHLKKSVFAFVVIVAFLLEMVAFATFGLIANTLISSGALQTVLWVVLTGTTIYFWSQFMSPKAPKRLAWRFYYPVKAVIYGISAIAIWQQWGAALALIFACISIVVDAVLYPYRELDLAQYFGGPNKSIKQPRNKQ
jgi:hypothetical protein